MEQNTPIIAKKIWNLMRVAFFMLRKGISKRKILLDLKLVMKRGNIAGKALQNLMFHHHQNRNQNQNQNQGLGLKAGKNDSTQIQCFTSPPPGEYEFSCSSTPSYHHFFSNKKKHEITNSSFFTPYSSFEDMDNNIEIVVDKMFDMMSSSEKDNGMASPAVLGLGFGRNPGIRQLRITDSPFPMENTEDSKHVDAAAEDFIKKFYSQLKDQKYY